MDVHPSEKYFELTPQQRLISHAQKQYTFGNANVLYCQIIEAMSFWNVFGPDDMPQGDPTVEFGHPNYVDIQAYRVGLRLMSERVIEFAGAKVAQQAEDHLREITQ